MNSVSGIRLYQLAMVGALFVALGSTATAQKTLTGTRKVQGTWTVTVQTRDCQTGVALGNPFLSLLTFADGGTMTETTSNPNFYPNDRGPGHGVWFATGWNSYNASSTAFITSSGQLVETQVITQSIAMDDDPDTFQTVKASVQFFDPNGNLLRSGCATAVGQRFK